MRDPNRIDNMLTELGKIWHQVPDWRFGQLMSNMLGTFCAKENCQDIFFPEDDKMLDFMKKYLNYLEKGEDF